jgi:mannose-6-phosphate isomerase
MAVVNYPVFFAHERVWRCYTGGMLLDRFVGRTPELDGHLPEDWLASTVRAANGVHSQGLEEGLAHTILPDGRRGPLLSELLLLHAEDIIGMKHIAKFGKDAAVLCKYLDSSIRLPLQCHPDTAIAEKLYSSRFGKTECWHIIGTHQINGEEPYILIGFKPDVTRTAFMEAAYAEDAPAMAAMLHKIHVSPGQTYFVPGRMPHAIGSGVFILEVQEPSDWVIVPERYCADVKLSDSEMWGPLTKEQALDVFDYTAVAESSLMERLGPTNRIIYKSGAVQIKELIGERHTSAFGLLQASILGKGHIRLPREFAVIVVEEGTGTIRWSHGESNIQRGDYFLHPAGLSELEYIARDKLELLICLGPAI